MSLKGQKISKDVFHTNLPTRNEHKLRQLSAQLVSLVSTQGSTMSLGSFIYIYTVYETPPKKGQQALHVYSVANFVAS